MIMIDLSSIPVHCAHLSLNFQTYFDCWASLRENCIVRSLFPNKFHYKSTLCLCRRYSNSHKQMITAAKHFDLDCIFMIYIFIIIDYNSIQLNTYLLFSYYSKNCFGNSLFRDIYYCNNDYNKNPPQVQ